MSAYLVQRPFRLDDPDVKIKSVASGTSCRFKILSLDGGGIRGVFGAKYLDKLQESIPLPIAKYFDLVVGTSTGGIIAIGLGLGLSPKSILDMYKENGRQIFPDTLWVRMRGMVGSKHNSSKLHSLLKEKFVGKRLGDSECRLCIPTLDETSGKIKVLKTDHHPDLFVDYQRPAWEVAAATSAAPYYYSSFLMNGTSSLLDGGVWANNPSLVGLCEAIKMFDKTPKDVAILSIGTGQENLGNAGLRPSSLGLLRRISTRRFVRLAFSAQSQAVDRIVEYLSPGGFIRINPTLPHEIFMDDVSKIPYLEGLADQAAQETLGDVKRVFFNNVVQPFIPEHKKKGEGR